jgi:hypothetical protein
MSSRDIESDLPISAAEQALKPKFAASLGRGTNNNLFVTYIENNKVKLRCSRDGGNSPSSKLDLFDVSGRVPMLKIASKGDIAVVVAVEETSGGFKVKGAAGTISPDGASAKFTHRVCPESTHNDNIAKVLDLSIRINDDGTSDDYVYLQGTSSVNVGHVGHHPSAPSPA